eukprot:CAMPEP_0113827882 /NCGR_PEP_ID=MMETSP0328-20130328/4993_1 /TAXON_ID=39455 /ORGANISM="Alexandrium minutum" /LENGTH=88 /DNA_ID=CAMNT_0000795879 /DNA_START=9 /DNA_END=271 /DNA_ORIENTATION=+ /assembly_acc=CAM_ASM_000350
MGIPRFYRWLGETFPDAFSTQDSLEAEHVYIDMNTILHEVLRSMGPSPSEARFLAAFLGRLDALLARATPRRSLFLALDGPAPTAKLP